MEARVRGKSLIARFRRRHNDRWIGAGFLNLSRASIFLIPRNPVPLCHFFLSLIALNSGHARTSRMSRHGSEQLRRGLFAFSAWRIFPQNRLPSRLIKSAITPDRASDTLIDRGAGGHFRGVIGERADHFSAASKTNFNHFAKLSSPF